MSRGGLSILQERTLTMFVYNRYTIRIATGSGPPGLAYTMESGRNINSKYIKLLSRTRTDET